MNDVVIRQSRFRSSTGPSGYIVDGTIRAALAEDLGARGDITSQVVTDCDVYLDANIMARRPGVVAGLTISLMAFEIVAVAETGIDLISLRWLSHSAPHWDITLNVVRSYRRSRPLSQAPAHPTEAIDSSPDRSVNPKRVTGRERLTTADRQLLDR